MNRQRTITLISAVAAGMAAMFYLLHEDRTAAVLASTHTAPSMGSTSSPTVARALPSTIRLVDQYEELTNSKDILAAALRVKATGTADEKGWAADLIRECYGYLHSTFPDARTRQLMPAQEQARKGLLERCSSVNTLSGEDRKRLVRDLRDAAAGSTTEYGMLHMLRTARESSSSTTLGPGEQEIVQKAFYGDEPLLRREAYNTIAVYMDISSKEGQERSLAFARALSKDVIAPPQSEFDQLQRCVTADWMCGGEVAISPLPKYDQQKAIDAWERRFKEAVDNKASVQSLLTLN